MLTGWSGDRDRQRIILNKSGVDAVLALAVLTALVTGAEALAVFFDTASLLAVTTFDGGVLVAEGNGCSDHDFIDSLGPELGELLGVLAALAVAVLTVGSYVNEMVPFEKHSQYSFRHLDFLHLHFVIMVWWVSSADSDIL